MHHKASSIKDPLSFALMTVSVAASVLTILSARTFSQKADAQAASLNKYDYYETYEVTYVFESIDAGVYLTSDDEKTKAKSVYEDLLEGLSYFDAGNVTMSTYLTAGDTYSMFYTDIVICVNETLKYETANGAELKDDGVSDVLIGKSLEPYVYEDGGQTFIDIENERMLVAGILDNDTASGLDERIVVMWNELSDNIKDTIISRVVEGSTSGIVIMLDTDESISAVKTGWDNLLTSLGLSYSETERENESGSIDAYYSSVKKTILVIAALFSVCSCLGASYIWIYNHEREFAVRQTFGYYTKDIFLLALKEFALIYAAGIAAGFAVYEVSALVGGGFVMLSENASELFGVLGMCVIFPAFFTVIPVGFLSSLVSPAYLFHKRGL